MGSMCQTACCSIQSVPETIVDDCPVCHGDIDGDVVEHVWPLSACVTDACKDDAESDSKAEQEGGYASEL